MVGVDPGTRKCGYAVVLVTGSPALAQGIVTVDGLGEVLAALRVSYGAEVAAVGGGTYFREVEKIARAAGFEVARVDERETTLRARARFFEAHPPRGWRRLIPRGMLLPDRPIDDFAAVLIAERFLTGKASVIRRGA